MLKCIPCLKGSFISGDVWYILKQYPMKTMKFSNGDVFLASGPPNKDKHFLLWWLWLQTTLILISIYLHSNSQPNPNVIFT
jgi:hypothetical protein